MSSLLDSSIVNALARYRLINEALEVCGIARADVFVLRELKHQFASNLDRRNKPILDAASLKVALDFYNDVGTHPQPLQIIPSAWVNSQDNKLLNTRNDDIWHEARRVKVDGGEAELFAATSGVANFKIWTADVKSLIALSKWPGCGHVHTRILGTVYCLERLVRELVTAHGFAAIAPKIVAGHYHSIDSAMNAGAAGCEKVLLAREIELQAACGGLLVP